MSQRIPRVSPSPCLTTMQHERQGCDALGSAGLSGVPVSLVGTRVMLTAKHRITTWHHHHGVGERRCTRNLRVQHGRQSPIHTHSSQFTVQVTVLLVFETMSCTSSAPSSPESQLTSCVTASWPGRHGHFPCIQGATTWAGTRGTARPGNSTMLTWQPRTKPTPESRALQTFVAIIPTSHCPVWLMVMAVMNHRRRQSLGASRRHQDPAGKRNLGSRQTVKPRGQDGVQP